MTDQKRDESTKCYPPIQSDPARRIRRIQRIGFAPLNLPEISPKAFVNRYMKRFSRCKQLMRTELAWLCLYAIETDSAFVARGAIVSILEASVDRNRKTIAEQKARIEELEGQLVQCGH